MATRKNFPSRKLKRVKKALENLTASVKLYLSKGYVLTDAEIAGRVRQIQHITTKYKLEWNY